MLKTVRIILVVKDLETENQEEGIQTCFAI